MRIAMGIEYDGADWLGFQRQSQGPTIQSKLEAALSEVAATGIVVQGSGRTDSGVHASGQVIHFDTRVSRSARAWTLGCNSHLPASIAVRWAMELSDEFHARFSATGRQYRYRIVNRATRPALRRQWRVHIREPLNASDMHFALQTLLGEHDFSAFRAQSCGARHAVRRLTHVEVVRRDELVDIVIAGNAFLHHMVRNITGSLLEIGRGQQPVNWLTQLLASRDRKLAAATAPAHGLCLERVDYPQHFKLPEVA